MACFRPSLTSCTIVFTPKFTPEQLSDSLTAGLHLRLKDLLNFFARQVVDEDYHALLGPDYLPFVQSLAGYQGLRYLLSFAVLGGLGLCAFRFLRRRAGHRRRAAGLLLTLTAVPLLLLGLSRLPLIPAYFIIFYPMPFLFAALFIDWALGA